VGSQGRSQRPGNAAGRGPGGQQTVVRRGQAMVFAIDPQEARDNNAVVAGTLFICSYDAQVLIDLGVTHSFVPKSFANKLGKNSSLLDIPLTIATPLSQPVDMDLVYKDYEVIFGEHKLKVDLI